MQSKTSTPPRRNSNYRDDLENSSLAQVLSQRLTNMEQQLFLLRDDLKNATRTLKEKDRQIQTLQNRIALAERRRELEEAGEPVEESLKDFLDGGASKSNSKRDVLENEVVTLAKKLEEMEKFFGDYGLAWVKEDALDEKDPNNLWIRKSNIHYTPDFDKVFLVVEELNLGNAEPQIVKKGNTAQFKNAQLLNLTLYSDGIQLESNPFRKYDSPSVEEFFRDLEDGYFPTELKGNHPEGVIFKVKDKRTMKFADDPGKRPVISGSSKPLSPSSPSSLSSLKALSRKSTASDQSPSRRASSLKRRISSKKTSSIPSKVSGDVKPMDPTGESKEAGGSPVTPASTSAPLDNLVPSSAMGPAGRTSSPANEKSVSDTAVVGTKREPDGKPADTDVQGVTDGKGESATGGSPGDEVTAGGSPGGGVAAGGPHGAGTSDLPSHGTGSAAVPLSVSQQETGDDPGFKELFRADSPRSSISHLPQPADPISAQLKDAHGLPRPPFSSRSNTTTDVRPLPLGPPSKQFNNFLFPKTTETQTSITLIPGVAPTAAPQAASPQFPQPTHITNITYNEAPITVQMTPSELSGKKITGTGVSGPSAMQEGTICPTHQPYPCNCVRIPCETCPSSDQPSDGPLGSVGLAKFPAETEYRQKFTESAINNINVLDFKKKSQQSRSPSPHPVPRQPAATLLVGPDEAHIPPDPRPPLIIDPNVKWEHFTFLGRPKGLQAVETPATNKGQTPKRKSSPQVVQLNEKTSDRMIAVRMRTKSGRKEYLAHLYSDEPVSKVWSLLKLNEQTFSLSTEDDKIISPKTIATELSTERVLRIVISKNEEKMVKSHFDPTKLPVFTEKDPEIFKTQSGGKKKNRSHNNRRVVTRKYDARTLEDYINEVKLAMKENADDESGDLFVSPQGNRDWLSKEVYGRKSVPRVSSKDLDCMMELLRNVGHSDPRVDGELTIVSISGSHIEAGGPPTIVSHDGSALSMDNDSKNGFEGAGMSESRRSTSFGFDISRSSSLISDSEVHVGSFMVGPRPKSVTTLSGPPADYPGSVHSIDLGQTMSITDVRVKSNHSLIFKRQISAADAHATSGGGWTLRDVRPDGYDVITGPRPEKIRPLPTKDPLDEPSQTLVKLSAFREDLGPSGIGHYGFGAAARPDIVRAMLEAEQDHERDGEEVRQSYRIVVPKPSPEPSPQPSRLILPEDVAKELDALTKAFVPSQQPEPPAKIDREFIERILEVIRTKNCSLDDAIKEVRKLISRTSPN